MVKLGIIQTRQYSSNSQAVSEVSKTLLRLAKNKVDAVCLPEQWLTDNMVADFDSEFSTFKEISRKYHISIVAGAFYQKINGRFAILAPVIHDGQIVGVQQKIHPFGYEKQTIIAGTEAKVFDTGIKFGVIICYDMVFADVANIMAKKGAEVLFSPSRIIYRGIVPWHIYVQARSLENRIPILAANVHNAKFGGKSIIVDLKKDGQIMLPKTKIITSGSALTNRFCLEKYKKSRFLRYSDKQNFS